MLAGNRSIVRGSSTKWETVRINAPGSICLELWLFIGTSDVYFGAEYLYHSRIPFLLILHPAAAAAESLQSCPTLCDPIDSSHQAPPSLLHTSKKKLLEQTPINGLERCSRFQTSYPYPLGVDGPKTGSGMMGKIRTQLWVGY